MIIQVAVEVKSKEALATILRVGSEYSLHDYNVIDFKILKDTKRSDHE
jgi:hypothetical protein